MQVENTLPNQELQPDETCDGFVNFVQANEKNPSSQEYMLHTLNSFKILIQVHQYEKATWELKKVLDLIGSTYETDRSLQLPDTIQGGNCTIDGCRDALRAVFEIYVHAVQCPQKQYQSENRTITINLSIQ